MKSGFIIDLAYTTNELVPYDPLLLNRLSWILSGRLQSAYKAEVYQRRRLSRYHARKKGSCTLFGRTGVIVGSWLVRSGTVVDGEAALAYLVEKWKWIEKNWRSPTTPDTPVQFDEISAVPHARILEHLV